MAKTAYHPAKGPVVLCIMDGWGHRTDPAHNAVALANTPVFDKLWANCPHSFLAASGADVGLPDGQVGNSEVGHINIGAGRVVQQDLPRLNAAAEDGSLTAHPALQELASHLASTGGTAHVIGLVSPGGVHAHQDHVLAVVNGLAQTKISVVVHAFTDGRDVLPSDAGVSLPDFIAKLPENATLGSLTGGIARKKPTMRLPLAKLIFMPITACKHCRPAMFAVKVTNFCKRQLSADIPACGMVTGW